MITELQPKFTITNRIITGLIRIERATGFLETATMSESWVCEMGNRALVLGAHHTAHIEGTRLTLDQAERLCGKATTCPRPTLCAGEENA